MEQTKQETVKKSEILAAKRAMEEIKYVREIK